MMSSSILFKVQWIRISDDHHGTFAGKFGQIDFWICVAPIWVLPDYFRMLEMLGARRIIAVSSTSRFTKNNSSAPDEKVTAHKLSESEDRLETFEKMENTAVDQILREFSGKQKSSKSKMRQ